MASWRGAGAGRALLDALVEEAARRGHERAVLNAQAQAVPFYEKSGFAVTGEAFMEADIPHVVMTRRLR